MKTIVVAIFTFLSVSVAAKKIVSLSPVITEIIYTLKVEKDLVGVSSFCQYPESACSHVQVGTALTPDMEKILALSPDVIYSQEIENSAIDKKAKKLGLKVENLKFNSFEDIINSIRKMGRDLSSLNYEKVILELENDYYELKKIDKKGKFIAVIDVIEKIMVLFLAPIDLAASTNSRFLFLRNSART